MKYYEQIHKIEYKSGGKVGLYYLSIEWTGTGVWQEGLGQARLWKLRSGVDTLLPIGFSILTNFSRAKADMRHHSYLNRRYLSELILAQAGW